MDPPHEQSLPDCGETGVCAVPYSQRAGPDFPRLRHKCLYLIALLPCLLVAVATLPLLLLVRLLALLLPGRPRAVARLVLLYGVYLLTFEVVAVAGLLCFRPSYRQRPATSPDRVRAELRLVGRATGVFFGPGLRAIGMRLRCAKPPPELADGRPVVVLARHAGLLNAQLGMHLAAHTLNRRMHTVCKRAVTSLPGAAAAVRVLPMAPVHWNAAGRARARLECIGMGHRIAGPDAAVLFPEGTNFSRHRRRAAIDCLRRKGRSDLAAAAEAMPCVLPPHSTGAAELLAAAPDAHVLVLGHTGLEDLLPWCLGADYPRVPRGADGVVHHAWWSYPPGSVPHDRDGIERWLYQRWAELDAWVLAVRAHPSGGTRRELPAAAADSDSADSDSQAPDT